MQALWFQQCFFNQHVHRSISECYWIPLGKKESDSLLWSVLKWLGICIVLARPSGPIKSNVIKQCDKGRGFCASALLW